jgi:hypothetical protein
MSLKIGILYVFRNILNENIMSKKFFFVASKKLSIELKPSALLSINFEISHILTSFLELDWVFDAYDGSPEWSCDVFSDLWSSIKGDSGFFLECYGDFL